MNDLERRLQKLEAQNSALERQLSELRARAEIADLMGRYAVYYGAGWGERIVSELWSRDEENVSLEYGKKVILEQSFRPEDYIFSGEELLLDFQDIQVVGTGSEESAEAQSMKVTPVQDSVLEHVRKTSYQGTLDVDLDRTYDEKLFIAEIHLIRSDHHSMIDEVGRPPFDQYVSSAEQLMILEQLHEYLVP